MRRRSSAVLAPAPARAAPPLPRDLAARAAAAEALLRSILVERFPGRAAAVSSFGADSAVLLHLTATVDRATPVLFIDTLRHFPETLAFRDALAADLGLSDLRIVRPDATLLAAEDAAEALWRRNPDRCCTLRKVAPLARALGGFAAWISGRKRFQGASRSTVPVLESEAGRLKVNPLADWSAADLAVYAEAHRLRAHPLAAQGYPSIGCRPCTTAVAPGEDARAGRWRGTAKTECGIHRRDAVAPASSADGCAPPLNPPT